MINFILTLHLIII